MGTIGNSTMILRPSRSEKLIDTKGRFRHNDGDNSCIGNRMLSDCSPNSWGSDSDCY